MENIYKTIFDAYNEVMRSAINANDGSKVIRTFDKATYKMIHEGKVGTELHRLMSKWVTEQSIKALDKMPKSIKDYAKDLGSWDGKKATLICGQYRELKPFLTNYNSRLSKEKVKNYFELLDNTENASVFLFGWNMVYSDFPSIYLNTSDEKMIKELIKEYSGLLEEETNKNISTITGSTVYQMAILD